ncbi:MAG TPA: VOC family protein [Steroidobacteraceae bacterium]|nr:VOC family protein [Steroidobacteraceae bacterium]
MRIEHVGVWVRDLETVAAFYAKYFGARVGELYQNPRKKFESRFLAFDSGARLEIMRRGDVVERAPVEQLGLAHVAIAVGDEAQVDALAARFIADGVAPESGPRRTGDGYYECVVRDPEGNRVEIAAAGRDVHSKKDGSGMER